jgi:hypothetical protein
MPWVRLDDRFTEDPKVVEVGPLASWLYVSSIAYAARNLTDGFIPKAMVPRLADFTEIETLWPQLSSHGVSNDGLTELTESLVSRLLCAELWQKTDGGFQIHNYLEYQPSREQVLKERAANKERQERHRNAKRNGVSNATNNGPVTTSRTRPVPVPDPYPSESEEIPVGTAAPSSPVTLQGWKEIIRAGENQQQRVKVLIDMVRAHLPSEPKRSDEGGRATALLKKASDPEYAAALLWNAINAEKREGDLFTYAMGIAKQPMNGNGRAPAGQNGWSTRPLLHDSDEATERRRSVIVRDE